MISLQNISKSYSTTNALERITLNFREGSCFGLVGPNGAGKSTLMKIIAGIITQDKGKVITENMTLKQLKKEIGYVPQEICLSETLTAEQNLAFFGSVYHIKGKTLKKRIDDILSYVGLHDQKKARINTFSGGMKRRLNIGCALIHEPSIILLDEPTVGIDPQSRNYILEMIRQMKQANRTILYSSHYMEEVEKICDDVAFLDKGKVLVQQKIEALLQEHASPTLFVKWEEAVSLDMESLDCEDVQAFQNGYLIQYDQSIEMMEQILNYSKQHDLTLKKFELIQPSLEDIFFSFTGQELRA